MTNHCDSWDQYADQCNGTVAECRMLVEEDEEFLMDTEEHRRILAQANPKKKLSLDGLDKYNPACGNACTGLYRVNPARPCVGLCPR